MLVITLLYVCISKTLKIFFFICRTRMLRRYGRLCIIVLLFFFSSRRRHTRLQGDWSSDVCSSDLTRMARTETEPGSSAPNRHDGFPNEPGGIPRPAKVGRMAERRRGGWPSEGGERSEERRVGKEGRSRWSPDH